MTATLQKLASNDRIKKIYGIDYSYKMIEIAMNRCKNSKKIEFLKIDMKNLQPLRKKLEHERLDLNIIYSINSILPRDPRDKRKMLSEIAATLKPGNKFVAVLPSFDTIIYLKDLTFEDYKEKRINEIVRLRDYLKILYYLKFLLKMHHSDRMYLLKVWNWNKKETGAMLKTWEYFYHERKMNCAKRLYADDQVNVQTFFDIKDIKDDLKKARLELLDSPKKLNYPWDYTRDHSYGNFPNKEQIWDWFVEAKKMEKISK
jgi:SAM-dependent methyltransferase